MSHLLGRIGRDAGDVIGAAYLALFPVVWAALAIAGRFGKDWDRRKDNRDGGKP